MDSSILSTIIPVGAWRAQIDGLGDERVTDAIPSQAIRKDQGADQQASSEFIDQEIRSKNRRANQTIQSRSDPFNT